MTGFNEGMRSLLCSPSYSPIAGQRNVQKNKTLLAPLAVLSTWVYTTCVHQLRNVGITQCYLLSEPLICFLSPALVYATMASTCSLVSHDSQLSAQIKTPGSISICSLSSFTLRYTGNRFRLFLFFSLFFSFLFSSRRWVYDYHYYYAV